MKREGSTRHTRQKGGTYQMEKRMVEVEKRMVVVRTKHTTYQVEERREGGEDEKGTCGGLPAMLLVVVVLGVHCDLESLIRVGVRVRVGVSVKVGFRFKVRVGVRIRVRVTVRFRVRVESESGLGSTLGFGRCCVLMTLSLPFLRPLLSMRATSKQMPSNNSSSNRYRFLVPVAATCCHIFLLVISFSLPPQSPIMSPPSLPLLSQVS